MSKKLTNNIYQFEDNETGWGSQMNQNLKALDDTIGELKNVYKKSEVDTELSNKQDKLTSTQNNAINSGIDSTKVSGYDAHVSDTDIHVTVSDKANWNAKPNKSTTLSGYGITNAYTKTEIDNSIKDFATKSTTLGGYGITDAYTKTEIDTKLSSVYKYKGSVAQYLDLPTQNNVVGDVWNVSSNGMNYAWDGATWDNLGATVDLSSYVKNTDYATTSKGGVIKSSSDSATDVVNGVLQATTKTTTQYNSADNSMFVSKGTLDNVLTSKDYATNTNLSAKANVSDVYTQTEVNNLVSKKADTTSVYTKTQIDSSLSGKQDKLSATQLSNIADVPNKANASDVYNKTDIDDKLNLKQDSLTQAQLNACNSGITATKVTNLETHTSNSNIHVTANDKNTWNAKQDALTSDQIANINSIPQLDSKYVKSDDTTVVRLNNLNEINLQEDHYNAWFGYRGGEVTNWKFGDGSEGGLADVYAKDFYLNDESLSEKLESKADDSNVVHKTGSETIGGTKTFSGSPRVTRTFPDIALNISDCDVTETPTEAKSATLYFRDKNNKNLSYVVSQQRINGEKRMCLRTHRTDNIDSYYSVDLDSEGNFYPEQQQMKLGTPTNKWTDVYATTFNGNLVGGVTGDGALSLQSKSGTSRIYLRDNVATSYPSSVNLYSKIGDNPEYGVFLNGQNFHPNINNVVNLGTNNYKWANVFTTLINGKEPAYDDNVVHKSGDETVGGIKTFNDLQTISYGTQYKGNRNAYILPEFASGYSGLSITTLSFSQTLKIGNFVLDDNNKPVLDTSKAYIQVATGENNNVNTCLIEPRSSTLSQLGTSVNKWSKVYSDDIVHTTGDENVGGQKIFSSNITGVGRDIHHFSTISYGKNSPPTSNVAQYVMFIGNKASDGFANSWYSGYLENRVDSNGTARGRWFIRNTDEQTVALELLSSIDGTRAVRPMTNNELMLGLTSHKWADVNTSLINGINPSSLSLPSINNTGANAWIALDTTDWVKSVAVSTAQKYIPLADGWLNVRVDNATMLAIASGGNYMHQMIRSETPNSLALLMPVLKGEQVAILVGANENTTYNRVTFYYCQGNI